MCGYACDRVFSMKKLKRILALIAAIALAGMYIVTFILGVTGNENTQGMLMASIAATVIIPVVFYAMILVARVLKRSAQEGTGASGGQKEKE